MYALCKTDSQTLFVVWLLLTDGSVFVSLVPARQIARWVHDMNCHAEGIRKAKGGGLYRPPSNTTLLVHNLKNGGFHYAAKMMIDGADSYVHKDCTADLGSLRRKKSKAS